MRRRVRSDWGLAVRLRVLQLVGVCLLLLRGGVVVVVVVVRVGVRVGVRRGRECRRTAVAGASAVGKDGRGVRGRGMGVGSVVRVRVKVRGVVGGGGGGVRVWVRPSAGCRSRSRSRGCWCRSRSRGRGRCLSWGREDSRGRRRGKEAWRQIGGRGKRARNASSSPRAKTDAYPDAAVAKTSSTRKAARGALEAGRASFAS